MERFDTPESISVILDVGVAEIRIDAAERTDTVVEVKPSDPAQRSDVAAAERTRVEYATGTLQIKERKDWAQWTPRSDHGSVDVRIELPVGSAVRGTGGVATMHASGRLGEVRFRTGAGDVELETTSTLELKAGVGDITVGIALDRVEIKAAGAVRLERVEGPAVVRNANGDTWIGEITGEAHLNGANGSIAVDVAHAGVVAKTARGDIHIGSAARGPVNTQSALGRVEIGIPDGVAAWLDLETKFGRVHNELESAERPEPGVETVEVHAQTAMGDVIVHRSLAKTAPNGA